MHIRLLITLMSLLVVSPLVHADDAADRAALEAAAQAWVKAFNARDPDAMMAVTTQDVVLLDPDATPVSGRKAARAAWARTLSAAQGQITSATKEAVIAGPIAWRIGALARKLPNGDLRSGQSLEIWKRESGQWKLHRQMASNLLAEANMAPRPMPSAPVLDKPAN